MTQSVPPDMGQNMSQGYSRAEAAGERGGHGRTAETFRRRQSQTASGQKGNIWKAASRHGRGTGEGNTIQHLCSAMSFRVAWPNEGF